MKAGPNRYPARSPNVCFAGTRKTTLADDLTIARRRMRHLLPWHVEPLPVMHFAIAHATEPIATEQRERIEQLALQVLAVQMWLANPQSAMH